MIGRRHMFQNLELKPRDSESFGGIHKGKIIETWTIGNNSFHFITNVLLVEDLMHNLMFLIQLSNNGYLYLIKSFIKLWVTRMALYFSAVREKSIYKIRLYDSENQNVKCHMSINEEQWTWHWWLGHVSMRRISKLNKLNF